MYLSTRLVQHDRKDLTRGYVAADAGNCGDEDSRLLLACLPLSVCSERGGSPTVVLAYALRVAVGNATSMQRLQSAVPPRTTPCCTYVRRAGFREVTDEHLNGYHVDRAEAEGHDEAISG
jgi:hypothetical protein